MGDYGTGNVGDDVLMTVTTRIALDCLGNSGVAVNIGKPEQVPEWAAPARYISLVDYQVIKARNLIYGGGGQFFSFLNVGKIKKRTFRQRLARIFRGEVGKEQFKKWLHDTTLGSSYSLEASRHGAFCVGVGPFEAGHPLNEAAWQKLSRCELLIVRDAMSHQLCVQAGLSHALVRTDACFLRELWLDDSPLETKAGSGRVAVIFRSWRHDPAGDAYLSPLRNVVGRLRAEGLKVTLVSLARIKDKELIEAWSDEEIIVYDPFKQSPSRFTRSLAGSFDLVVSARAHGIMLPALLGTPGICVGLEPKLENVHKMLPLGTRYWGPPFSEPELVDQVLDMLEHGEQARINLQREVQANQALARRARRELELFLREGGP
ncbi:MAG TPA: polysaccharide pyruvyl transferase family protein [bacterium]|nr:polysaccharide pyruvyl transferase family protein [bacterium]